MKYTFETEEEGEAKVFIQAIDASCCINEIVAYLRDYLKHRELDEPDYLRVEEIRNKILDIVKNYDISLLD